MKKQVTKRIKRRTMMTARKSLHVPVFMAVVAALCWSRPAWAPPGGSPQCQRDLNTCNANLSTCNNGRATCNTNLATCNSNLSQSQGNLATCNSNLSTCNGNLSQSQANLATCNTSLSQSEANLATCEADLEACEANASAFPASGQTTAFQADKNDGITGPVAVPDDGTVEAGATLNYTDNGDGTITDNNTGLMWEKKSDDAGLHDKDNVYRWSGDGSQETIWDWLEDVNAEGGIGFAEHNDWRLPNSKELQSIVNYGNSNPSVSSEFNNSCDPGDTVTDGSCTAASMHWSSTSLVGSLLSAWHVNFTVGFVGTVGKSGTFPVRAVRGGL